jgi:hypothetical protein
LITKNSERLPEAQSIASLLKKAGANPPRYGKKWDCPACGKRACLSVDEGRGLFNCFHDGCGFKGNTATLARRFGLAPKMSPGEYRTRQDRERKLDERVARLLAAKQERRNKVIFQLTMAYRAEHSCHTAGPHNPDTWDTLATIYAERLKLEAELLILDNASGPDLERFLGFTGAKGDRELAISNTILHGGLADRKGKFIPLETENLGVVSDGGPCAPGWFPWW